MIDPVDFPDPVVMSREEGALVYVMHDAPTKPEVCTCGHAGLGMMWHLQPCDVKRALVNLWGVLA